MADTSQSQRTPGGTKRRGPPRQHKPFQHDELNRGKRTGRPIRELDRNSDDMEDFDRLMSPGSSAYPRSGKSVNRRASAGTSKSGPSPLRRQVDRDEDDDEVSMDIDDSVIGASREFFESAHHAVGPRERSRAVPRTSDVDYDAVPSPGVSRIARRRSGVTAADARTPNASRRIVDVSEEEDELAAPPDSAATSRITRHSTAGPDTSGRRKSNKILAREDADVDEGAGDGLEDVPDPSPSAVRSRRAARAEEPDEEPEEQVSPRRSKAKGKGKQIEEPEPEPVYYDDDVRQFDDDDDGMDLNGAEEQVNGDEGEEEAGEEEEAEQQEEEAPAKARGRSKKGDAAAKKAAQAKASQEPKRRSSRSKRTEPERAVSEVINVRTHGEGHYFDDEGRRRNARVRYGPLEYWRNEKVIYGRRQSGVAMVPVIKQIVKLAPEPVQPLGAKKGSNHHWKKRKAEDDGDRPGKRARSDSPYYDEDPPEKGWDNKTDPLGVVVEFVSGNEVERRIAFTESMIQPREAVNAKFKFQKIFGDGEFLAAGMLTIPIGETKPPKSSKDNSYVFYVIKGAVKVQIYRTSFLISIGGMFLVPRGNVYSIENVAERETVLFFSQARKIPEDGIVSMQDSHGTPIKRHASATPGPSGASRSDRQSMPPLTSRIDGSPSTERAAARATTSRAFSERPNGITNGKRKAT